MATLKVVFEDGATTTESVMALPDGARFLAWIASAYAEAGATPEERLEAWWAGTVNGTAGNVQRWETTTAAQSAIEAVQDMRAVTMWKVGAAVKVGDLRFYKGATYECRQAHTTQADWTPPTVPALWSAV